MPAGPGSAMHDGDPRQAGRLVAAVILFLLLALSPGPASGSGRGVQVRPGGQTLFETSPGAVVTTTFSVANTADEPLEFLSEAVLPEGWKLVTPSFPFSVDRGGAEVRLVGVFVPRSARVGRYEIAYRVASTRHPAVGDAAVGYVTVLSVSNLQVQVIDAPDSVIAGDAYEARFSAVNAGNTENRLAVAVESGRNLPVEFAPREMTLAPGASGEVRVTVGTDEKSREGFKHILDVTLHSIGDEETTARASCAVDVIPRMTGAADRFHRIPARIALRYLGVKEEIGGSGFQGEFSGGGALSDDGDDEIAFVFQGPDTLEENSLFGERPRYFAGYRSRTADLMLGDGYYALSRLTEQGLEGRGASSRITLGDFDLRGYYMNTLRQDPAETQGALGMEYRFGERYRIGVNLLDRRTDDAGARLAGIQGLLAPMDAVNLEFEAAYGREENARDPAFWLSLYGSLDRAHYRIEYIRAAPDFPGNYRDREYASGNFFFRLTDRFSLNAAVRQEKENLRLDVGDETAGLTRFGSLGLGYQWRTGTSLALESLFSTREDRLSVPGYDTREQTLRACLGQRFRKAFFNLSAEWGDSRDRLEARNTRVGVYEASGYVMPTPNQTYGAYVRYSNRDDPENPGGDFLNAGLTGSLRLGTGTDIDARLETYRPLDLGYGERYTADAGIRHAFSSGWTVSARGRHTFHDRRNESAVVVELSIPFGLPTARKKGIGTLKGLVRHQETGAPLANAVLRLNGAAAVTDGGGEFRFPALKPGTVHLDVDAGSIGLDRVPMEKTPMAVTIEGGEEAFVEIGVARSAALYGRITIYEFAETEGPGQGFRIAGEKTAVPETSGGDEVAASRGLANALVVLTRETETLRVLTDGRGRFSLEGLRPGAWTLAVHAENLPPHHYVEKERFEILLTGGEKREVSIRVLPRKRTIRIIQEAAGVIEG